METEEKERERRTESDSTGGGHRDFSDLPDEILETILDRIISLVDFLALTYTCRSLVSLSKSKPIIRATRPPLLLRPILHQSMEWADPPQCRLHTPINTSLSYPCPFSSRVIRRSCIGISFGNLIIVRGWQIVIADVFTGHQIRAPDLAPLDGKIHTPGLLTAPPSSPDCRLLIRGGLFSPLCWRVGDKDWTEIPSFTVRNYILLSPIHQLVAFSERLHALGSSGTLLTIRTSPQVSINIWEEDHLGRSGLQLPHPMPTKNWSGKFQLVECSGQLLLVCFASKQEHKIKIQIYRLDTSDKSWVEMESLGDWCLFVDARGTCPAVSCMEPARWGGRSNCIYITGPGCETWNVLPLDGLPVDCLSEESPFSRAKEALPSWPSPLWVYPSSSYKH